MKLYLSSYKFGGDPEQLKALAGNNKKIAVISNALDFSSDLERRKLSEQKCIDELIGLSFEPELLDLRGYFGKAQALKVKMYEFGAVWVLGGNAFLLRSAMAQSGFDRIVQEYARNENKQAFIYGGFSAGVCVLSPGLKGIDLMDEPEKVYEIYNTEIVWDGLHIINFVVVPHYQSQHRESDVATKAVEYFESNSIPYKALKDGEVIIMEVYDNHHE